MEQSIPFLDEETWRCHWRLGGANTSGLQILLNKMVQLCLFHHGHWVNFAVGELGVWYQLNSMIPLAPFWKCVKWLLSKDIFILVQVVWDQISEGLWSSVLEMGFFQVLRKGACGMDLLIGGEDMAGKKPVPFLILPFFLWSCVLLFSLLYFYSGMGK